MAVSAIGAVLRPWAPTDAPALAAAWTEPDIRAHATVPEPADATRAADWIGGWAARRTAGSALDLVIASAADDAVWGEVGLAPFRSPPRGVAVAATLEAGWWVAPAHRRVGVATMSVVTLVTWAFAELAVDRVVARIGPGHHASERVAAHAGLVRRGPLDGTHDLFLRSATLPS